MNIGIFTDTYYPQINGVVTSTRMLEKELNKLGHKVYIFTTSNPNVKSPAFRTFRLPSMPFVFLPSHRLAVLYSPKILLAIKRLNLDIIHTQTEFPLGILGKAVSKMYGIPLVHTYHTMYEDYVHYIANGHLITPKMAKEFSKIFCNSSKVVIVPTEKVEFFLREYGVSKPIEIIPTGIDFEPFKKSNYEPREISRLKSQLGIEPADKVIVSIGRIAKEKSIDVVVNQIPKLIEKIPNAKFVIVGGGPLKNTLEKLVAELNIEKNVIFAGEQPWSTIGKFYQLGDLFISASVTETQGLTFAEAMAAQIPVVAKKDKSLEGLIKDKVTGYFFEKNEDLADLLYHVLSHQEEAEQIAQNALSSIEYLSSENFGKAVENVYRNVIHKK